MSALKARYQSNKLDSELSEERSWATEVRNRLHDEAEGLPPISKFRVRTVLQQNLDEVLGIGAHAPEVANVPAGPPN